MSDAEDRADVRRVLAGDAGAFEGLVRRWQGPLLNLAYRYCRDRGQAEELVQEVFLRVYRKLGQYREDARFSTWMFSVATRLCISHVRRTTPQFSHGDDLDKRSHWGNLAEAAEARDTAQVVREAVTRLPAKYRDALILYYFREKDVNESAKILGVAAGTLKARLHRGRELLRRRVAGKLTARPVAGEA